MSPTESVRIKKEKTDLKTKTKPLALNMKGTSRNVSELAKSIEKPAPKTILKAENSTLENKQTQAKPQIIDNSKSVLAQQQQQTNVGSKMMGLAISARPAVPASASTTLTKESSTVKLLTKRSSVAPNQSIETEKKKKKKVTVKNVDDEEEDMSDNEDDNELETDDDEADEEIENISADNDEDEDEEHEEQAPVEEEKKAKKKAKKSDAEKKKKKKKK